MADEQDDEARRKQEQEAGEEQVKPREPADRRAQDDEQFKARLAPYGVAEEDIFPDDLVVPPEKRLVLTHARGREKGPGFVQLRPQTIDDVKRWIGVPDEVGRQRSCTCELPESATVAADPESLGELDGPRQRNIHRMAQAYVRGDSATVAHFKNLYDHLVKDSWLNTIFLRRDIDVYGVLELGPDISLLWAGNVRIWPHGRIQVDGNAKLDCLSIDAVSRLEVLPVEIAKEIPPIGYLTALEDGHA